MEERDRIWKAQAAEILERKARAAQEAFVEEIGRAHKMPVLMSPWHELSEGIREAWRAAVVASENA